VLFPLRDQVAARTAGLPVKTEIESTVGRVWMSGEALDIIRGQPWNGVGLGAYVRVLAEELPGTFKVEPVHNLILLAAAELGVWGGLLGLAIGGSILAAARKARGVDEIGLTAVMAGLLAIAILDHYLWTMAPGRTLFWLYLGTWAGQVGAKQIRCNENHGNGLTGNQRLLL
jgi:hypothetical protein